jgi:hypothetical protein
MSLRAQAFEKWRPTTDSPRQIAAASAGLPEGKVWCTGVLQSSAVSAAHGEMALWAFDKAPFSAISPDFFDDFLRVFPRAFQAVRKLARIRPRKAPRRVQNGGTSASRSGAGG